MTRSEKPARPKGKPEPAAAARSPADDVEAARRSIVRKLEAFVGASLWRECPQRLCRRARRCEPPLGVCVGRGAVPPVSDQEWAPFAAEFKRMLEQRRAGLAAARGRDVKG